MINFVDLSPIIKMLVQTLLMLIFAVDIYMLIFSVKFDRRFIIPLGVVSVANGFMLSFFIAEYQCALRGTEPQGFLNMILHIPMFVLMFFILLALVLTAICIRAFQRAQRNTVTATSVKQSVDDLPLAICFGSNDGHPILVNRHMRDICIELTDCELQNIYDLWRLLSQDIFLEGIKRIRLGEKPIITLQNSRTWSFSKTDLNIKGSSVIQIKASDITQLYELSLKMEEKNAELAEINKRLERLKENITEATRNEEILYAKIKIHDDIGRALLSSSLYLSQGAGNPKDLLEQWNVNVMLLANQQEPEAKTNVFERLDNAAKAIGVRLVIDGDIPTSDTDTCSLIAMAAQECLTNAVRHADSNELYIQLSSHINHYVARFTNNGKKPSGPIREGSGLSGLRRHVELRRCTLHIESVPIFRMTLVIPKKRENVL